MWCLLSICFHSIFSLPLFLNHECSCSIPNSTRDTHTRTPHYERIGEISDILYSRPNVRHCRVRLQAPQLCFVHTNTVSACLLASSPCPFSTTGVLSPQFLPGLEPVTVFFPLHASTLGSCACSRAFRIHSLYDLGDLSNVNVHTYNHSGHGEKCNR